MEQAGYHMKSYVRCSLLRVITQPAVTLQAESPAPALAKLCAAREGVNAEACAGALAGLRAEFGRKRGGAVRVISDCHFAVPLNHFIPGFLSNSVAAFRK
jgi:hypothetical protein